MASNQETSESINVWINTVAKKGLPTLCSTVTAISKINADSDTPVDQLADYIKQDPGLTAHILRHTQGAYRVPLKGKNNTVNRAIVMLGFNEVKSLCFSLSVLEDIIHGTPRTEFLSQLGISFHAAIQARSLGIVLGKRNCEEIFTAALLKKLGDLTFWSLGGENATKLAKAILENPSLSSKDVEKKSLGFSLDELTKKLCSSWNIDSYLYGRELDPDMDKCVSIGYEIAESSVGGWDNSLIKETIKKAAEFTSQKNEIMEQQIRDNAASAIRYALGFGIPGISGTLNELSKIYNENKKDFVTFVENNHTSEYDTLTNESNDLFVLKTIKGIGTLLEVGTNINELVKLSLEGIHRGIAFDRAVFCLLSPNRKFLIPKSFINSYSTELAESFKIELDQSNIFGRCLFAEIPIWVHGELELSEKNLLPESIQNVLSKSGFIVAPIIVNSKAIGLFYVDRGIRNANISQDDYESFKQIVFQVRLALEHIASNSR